jgi:hypothetical protein
MVETGAKANGALQNIGAMGIYQADRKVEEIQPSQR